MTGAALGLLLALAAAPARALLPGLEPADERLLLRTVGGDIVIALYPPAAPEYVARLQRLARAGAYDGTHFHQIVPGSHARLSAVTARGTAPLPELSAGIPPVPDEFTAIRPVRGNVFWATHPGQEDPTKTAFSIVLEDWPDRLGRYTVFGRIETGLDVVDAFAATPRDRLGRPAARLEVLAAEIVSAKELARRRLAPARPIAPAVSSSLRAALGGLALMALLSGLAWLLRSSLPRAAASLSLLNACIGIFLVAAIVMPAATPDPWIGTVLFLGLAGSLKLMSRFESPAEPPRPSAAEARTQRIP